MARTFTGTSSMYGTLTLPTSYSTPFTIACRYRPTVLGTQAIVIALTGTVLGELVMYTGNKYWLSSTNYLIDSGITAVVGTQVNLMGVFASSTSRTLYVDGIQRGSTDNRSDALTIQTFSVAREITSFYASGTIQDAAFWNRALTAGEALAFHRGASPSLMPQGLKAYVPLWGNNSPEPNYCGTSMTLFNTPPKGTHVLNIL